MKKIILVVLIAMAVLSGCGEKKTVESPSMNEIQVKGIETETILVENIEVETIIH